MLLYYDVLHYHQQYRYITNTINISVSKLVISIPITFIIVSHQSSSSAAHLILSSSSSLLIKVIRRYVRRGNYLALYLLRELYIPLGANAWVRVINLCLGKSAFRYQGGKRKAATGQHQRPRTHPRPTSQASAQSTAHPHCARLQPP